MPLNVLRQLAAQRLPATVFNGADVDAVRVLVLAGHAKATVPEPVRTLAGHQQPAAVVTEITELGRAMLARFPERSMA